MYVLRTKESTRLMRSANSECRWVGENLSPGHKDSERVGTGMGKEGQRKDGNRR